MTAVVLGSQEVMLASENSICKSTWYHMQQLAVDVIGLVMSMESQRISARND